DLLREQPEIIDRSDHCQDDNARNNIRCIHTLQRALRQLFIPYVLRRSQVHFIFFTHNLLLCEIKCPALLYYIFNTIVRDQLLFVNKISAETADITADNFSFPRKADFFGGLRSRRPLRQYTFIYFLFAPAQTYLICYS